MINKQTTTTFHRTLFATEMESVVCLKRDDDQREGVVTSYKLFDCRWSITQKTGNPIQGEMSSNHRRTLHVPRVEMRRVGINYFNAADRFVDIQGRIWQPESTTMLDIKLFENHYDIECLRVDQ